MAPDEIQQLGSCIILAGALFSAFSIVMSGIALGQGEPDKMQTWRAYFWQAVMFTGIGFGTVFLGGGY